MDTEVCRQIRRRSHKGIFIGRFRNVWYLHSSILFQVTGILRVCYSAVCEISKYNIVFGESAGAFAIGSLLVADGGKAVQSLKLFRGAIMESGVPSGCVVLSSTKAGADAPRTPQALQSHPRRIPKVTIGTLPPWWDVDLLCLTEPRCSASGECHQRR